MTHRVFLELGPTKIVAYSLDWPGWARFGQTEQAALDALTDSAERYRVIAELAGLPFEPGDPVVVELIEGTEPVDVATAERSVNLLRAAWDAFDLAIAESPKELRTGSRDAVVAQLVKTEQAYCAKMGVHSRQFAPDDSAALTAMREEIAEVLGKPSDGSPLTDGGWPAAYAARQAISHVINHIWNLEDSRF